MDFQLDFRTETPAIALVTGRIQLVAYIIPCGATVEKRNVNIPFWLVRLMRPRP